MQINGVIFPEILPVTKRTYSIPGIENNNMFFMSQEELIERGILTKSEKPIKTKNKTTKISNNIRKPKN